MTRFTSRTISASVIPAAVGLLAVGCFADVIEPLGDLPRALACSFGSVERIDGDDAALTGVVACRDSSGSIDGAVELGAELDVLLDVPPDRAGAALRVESSDTDVLVLHGFDGLVDTCGASRVGLAGWAEAVGVGEAAIVVRDDGGEIDRFSVSVGEPAGLEIQASDDFYQDGALRLDRTAVLQAVVTSDEGTRLECGAAGRGWSWSVDDTGIAGLAGGMGSSTWLWPLALGSTTVRVKAGDLAASLPVQVTAVPEPPAEGVGSSEE